MSFTKMIQRRRSRYELSAQMPITEEELQELIGDCIKYVPSAFNCQGSRVMLLLESSHHLFWDMVLEKLQALTPPTLWDKTREKIASFRAAYGTILYFENTEVISQLKNKFPLYQDYFAGWAEQANAMLQFCVWTALAEKGIGASLQHYSPLIDEGLYQTFGVSRDWKLIAQMPFGKPSGPDMEKEFSDLSVRFKTER